MWQNSKKLETSGNVNKEEEKGGDLESRMYTVEQIRELFYLNLNRSEVRTKMAKAESNIKGLQSETEKLRE